jgi:Tol biopolymer transport system component
MLVAGIVLLLLVAAGGMAVGKWGSKTRRSAAPSIRYLTYSGRDYSPTASADGKRVCFTSDRDGTKRIWIKEMSSGLESPLTAGPDDFPRLSPDGSTILFTRSRGSERSLYRAPVIPGEPNKVLNNAQFGDWSPDGRRIAFVRWPEEGGSIIGIAGVDGSAEKMVHRIPEYRCSIPRWSPDGRSLAISINDRGLPQSLAVIDLESGKVRELPATHGYKLLSAATWEASGRHIFWSQAESASANSGGSTAAIFRQNVRSGEIENLLWNPTHSRVLDMLPNGNLLLDSRSSRENLKEFSLKTNTTGPVSLTLGNSTDRQPCYSADDEEIAFSSNRSGNLEIWSISRKTPRVVRRLTDHPADDWDPGFSPDGKHLLWSSARSGNLEVWIANADGSSPRQVTRDGFAAENPTMTRDGRWIVYSSAHPKSSGIWKIKPDGSDATLLMDGALVGNPEVSPDGKYAAYADSKSMSLVSVKVVDIETGASVFETQIPVYRETSVLIGRTRWMPDGKTVVFLGQDAAGVNGLFEQDFVPGQDTSASRRPLAGFDPENSAESFGIARDGQFITIAMWEQFFSIMVTEDLPSP